MKSYTKYIYIVTLIISSFCVSSCEKEVEVNLKSVEPRLVIEGIIEEGVPAKVKLTTTKDFYDDNTFESIKNAIVEISVDGGAPETLLFNDAENLFTSNTIIGEIGKKYDLSVIYDGKEYTSTSTMPELVPIDDVSMEFLFSMMDFPFPMVSFQDPPNVDNYYRHLIYINGQRVIKDDAANSDEFMDGSYIKFPITVYTNDDSDPFEKGDLITIEQQCVDKGTFLYFYSLAMIDNSMNNPTSNIEGGALGYFSAYSSCKVDIIADW